MRPKGGFALESDGVAAVEGANTIKLVVATESALCPQLLENGVGSAAVVTAAGEIGGDRATLGGHGNNNEAHAVSAPGTTSQAGTAIGGGDGGRNKSDECHQRSRNTAFPYTWSVCAKISKSGGGKGKPTRGSTVSASPLPTRADTWDWR